MKELMTGNEAIARGAYEAGVHFASAYPGTPSTEILENISKYREIKAEWAVNEKVALETVVGASLAGARSIASMKHVGLNVAADPMFTQAYMGVGGGSVIISADEPGQFSSQNEQDNRNYARAAMIPMFEPSDSQESKNMVIEAFRVSESFNTPVIIRMTTRVCHSKSVVETGERRPVPVCPYVKNEKAHVCVPANARVWRRAIEDRMKALRAYSETSTANFAEYHNTEKGVIVSGICYQYAKEVLGDSVSYLKLGFTNPLPENLIIDFCGKVNEIYVIEENDPIMENAVRALGFTCKGRDFFPNFGEMLPDEIRKAMLGQKSDTIPYNGEKLISRAPTLCAGCPHRGIFLRLGKRKDIMISGDIGCYTLAYSAPYKAMDTALCMGAGFSLAHGAQQVFNRSGSGKRVVGIMGDSTFFHSGINSLINTFYNHSNVISIILDNRITAMTGHQENPGSGFNAQGEAAEIVDIEKVVRAIGIKNIKVINPNDMKAVDSALDEFLMLDEPSVIITRWPCVLKKLSDADKKEFSGVFTPNCSVDPEFCIGCKLCLKTGCPALSFHKEDKKAFIDPAQCVGCGVCGQVCPKQAIKVEVR